jgi:hypothetical protein
MQLLCGLLLALAATMQQVRAGAPFQTDDPAVVSLGHSELLLFYQQTLAASGRSGVLPAFEFHYGAVQNVELDLVTPFAFSTSPGGHTQRGYGDTVLGLKYRLLEETDTAPLLGFAPKLNLATGDQDRGLGNGGNALFLPIWVQKRRGNMQGYGGGGYWINRGPNNRNYWFFGAQGQYQLSEQWVLGAEVFHTTAQTLDQRASTGFNVGGYYVVDARAQWLFSIGRGLQNAAQTNRVSSYLGFQRNY